MKLKISTRDWATTVSNGRPQYCHWFGTFYRKIKADTDGHILIRSLFPGLVPEETDEIRPRLDEWVAFHPPKK